MAVCACVCVCVCVCLFLFKAFMSKCGLYLSLWKTLIVDNRYNSQIIILQSVPMIYNGESPNVTSTFQPIRGAGGGGGGGASPFVSITPTLHYTARKRELDCCCPTAAKH